MRRVTARALVVGEHEGFAKHVHLRVAGAARECGALLKLVRLVAGDALAMTICEQRSRWNERRLAGVALGAGSDRLARLPVLMLVAGRANLNS